METSDVFSFIAILISIGTFAYANSIEAKIRRQADKKAAFDQWLSIPIDSNLRSLKECGDELFYAIYCHHEKEQRIEAVREIQKSKLEGWYFELDAICSSKADAVLTQIRAECTRCFDKILGSINKVESDGHEFSLEDEAKNIHKITQRCISNCKALIEAERLKIK